MPDTTPIELPAAILSMPTLAPQKIHFSTAEFIANLETFRGQIDDIIAALQQKKPGDGKAFEVKFQFNYTCNNSTETSLSTVKDQGTLTLSCYCNGGN